MDFTLPPDLEAIRKATRSFVSDHILPIEADRTHWDEHDNIKHAPLAALREKAKAAGLWGAASTQGVGWNGPANGWLGSHVRGSQPVDFRSGDLQLCGPR